MKDLLVEFSKSAIFSNSFHEVSEFCDELNSGHLIIKFEDNSLLLIILVQLGNVLNTLTSFVDSPSHGMVLKL